MANQVGEVYKVNCSFEFEGRICRNIYFYEDAAGTTGGFDAATLIGEGFADVVLPEIVEVMPDSVAGFNVEVTSLWDPLVLYDKYEAIPGVLTDEVLPGFVALGFSSKRTRTDIRRGQKRIGPITESVVTGEEPNIATFELRFDAIEAALGAPLQDSLFVDNYFPVVVARIAYTTPSGKTAYKLPSNDVETEVARASEWNLRSVTTQDSRKKGRGE